MDIATRPPPYFEEQRQRLCGLHALNHAVGFRAFAEADMEAAVEIILDEASAAAHAAGVASEERRGNHVHPGGDYSEQVLAGALLARGGWVFDQVPLKHHARGYETIWDVGVVGALVHIPGHWLALRSEEEDLWLVDSLQARPSYVGRKGSATVAAMLASYSSIFLVRAEGVVATAAADGAEMRGQAPDPDGGEGRQGAGATSARVPVDVSAQPPATDGAEARPGRPCAAPMPACAQESTRDEAWGARDFRRCRRRPRERLDRPGPGELRCARASTPLREWRVMFKLLVVFACVRGVQRAAVDVVGDRRLAGSDRREYGDRARQ